MQIVDKDNLKYSFRKIKEWAGTAIGILMQAINENVDAIRTCAVPQFDVITPKGRSLSATYHGIRLTPSLRDRPVGLRFASLPDPDYGWDVKVYVYNTRKGKKYVELLSFGLEELDVPYSGRTSMFRTLPASASLMNLLSSVWTPWDPNGIVPEGDEAKAAQWLWLLEDSTGRAWNSLRSSRQSTAKSTDDCRVRWSASFGIRIISRNGMRSSDMKTFRVGVLSNPPETNTPTYSFCIKNKV